MKKICLVTEDFCGLGFVTDSRVSDYKIIIAVNPKEEKNNDNKKAFENIGKGIVDVFPLSDIMKKRDKMKDWYFIWDRNHSLEENKILKKEGFKVGLGGELPFKMEEDREFGIKLAESLGLPSPMWKNFTNKEEGIKYLEENCEKAFVFKPNGQDAHLTTVIQTREPDKANKQLQEFVRSLEINDFILQERVDGIEVNLEYFCINGEVKLCQLNLEAKRIHEEDRGSMIGCAFDICRVIPLDSKLVQMTVGKLLPLIKKTKHAGFADLNCIIGEDCIWFLEWCWRTGYNAHPNFFSNIEKKAYLTCICDMVDGKYIPETKRGFGASITVLTEHPHKGIPVNYAERYNNKIHIFDGIKKGDKLTQSGWKGAANEVAICMGYGYTIKEAFNDAKETVEAIDFVNKDYRGDFCKENYYSSPLKRYESLISLGLL